MTMFSMKPKFDLAEFLATPASAAVTRSRNAKRRRMLAQPAEEAEDTPGQRPPKTPRQIARKSDPQPAIPAPRARGAGYAASRCTAR